MSWVLYAFLAAALTGTAALLEKKSLNHEHAASFVASLSLATLVISLVIFLPTSNFSVVTPAIFSLIGLGSIFGASSFLLISKAMRHMEVSTVSPLLVAEPGMVAILALLMLGEKLTSLQIVGVIILIIGTFILEIFASREFKGTLKSFFSSPHVRYIFLAMLIYSLTSILDRLVLSRLGLNTQTYLIIIHSFFSAFFVTVVIVKYGGLNDIAKAFKNQGLSILLIAVITVLYRFFQMQAVALASVGLVVAIKRTSALFATIIGGELWHEHNLVKKIFACIMMVLGAILVVV